MTKDGKEINNIQDLPIEVRQVFARLGADSNDWNKMGKDKQEKILQKINAKPRQSMRPSKPPGAPPPSHPPPPGTPCHIEFKYKVVHHEKDLSNLKVDPLRVPKK